MLCKYYLQIGDNTVDIKSPNCIEVTQMMADSANFVTAYTRPYYNGVIRKSNSKLLLIGEARRLLIEEYRKNYLNSKAAFSVYCIDNRWEYYKAWECPLDFATFEYDTYYAELFCKDNSATALIKSNNNTKFEYLVDELKDENKLNYDGMTMQNKVKYIITSENVEGEDYTIRTLERKEYLIWYPPLFVEDSIISVNDSVVLHEQKEKLLYSEGKKDASIYFLECIEDCAVTIDLTKLNVSFVGSSYSLCLFNLYKIKSDGTITTAYGDGQNGYYYVRTVSLEKGDKLQLNTIVGNSYGGHIAYIYSNDLPITWTGRMDSINVDCISLNTLLGKILSSISSDMVTLTGSISETINGVENERLKNTKIVAAESIRQMVGAKIYTSFKDFSAFMESVFGYVYEIIPVATEEYTEDSIITFKHRSEVFANEVVKSIRIATETRFCINKGLIYSALKIGYEKQDYDNGNNGFDEYNFTNHYKTGTTLSTTTLELLCPYRADCYGFEQVAEKRGKSKESSNSDNDVFIVKVLPELSNNKYIIDRNLNIEGAFSNTVFNGTFAPPYMVEANKQYIGSFCKKLKFASSEGNSTIIVGGVPMSADIELNDPLFSVGEVAFKTNDFILPKNFQGLIEFEWEGRKYQGYLADVELSYASSGILEYKLLEKLK